MRGHRMIRSWLVVLLVVVLVAGTIVADPSGVADAADDGHSPVAAGGFSDDDGWVHEWAIDALAAEGVFEGTECGAGLFCPGEPILRWVMAVWLVRILDGEDPAARTSRFVDVEGDVWWARHVERLADLGVTQGCALTPARFCPWESVTRAQMASFLVRAFALPPSASHAFTDLKDGGSHTANIASLAASGITSGCATGPLRYCPQKSVTRAQMATFLARAQGLVETPTPGQTDPQPPAAFDPLTTPTLSDIDLDRLAEAAATIDPTAECPATSVPASLDDVAEVLRIADGCTIVEYEPLNGRTLLQVREALADDQTVHAVGVPVVDIYPDSSPYDEDDQAGEQWHLPQMNAAALWEGWPDGATVTVAVIDDGVDGNHRDLSENLITTGNPCHRTPTTNTNDHGTHVAGIIAAEQGNGHDVAGIAPNAKILPIKIHYSDDFDNGNPSDSTCYDQIPTLTRAVTSAINDDADIINMSFRWHPEIAPSSDQDTAEAAIRAAMLLNIVVVVTSGNRGGSDNRIQYPAAYPGVIAVANTQQDGSRYKSSTANNTVYIAAPGTEILSTVPAYRGLSCLRWSPCTTARFTGTSMAAPVISGVVAHMKARYPRASLGDIRQALYETAENPDKPGAWTPEYGWGIVQPLDAIARLRTLANPPLPDKTFALVLDASGSMADFVPEGRKIDIAVDAITATYQTITEELGQQAEVLVYSSGGGFFGCTVPSIESASKEWARSWVPVPTVVPGGSTPTGRALQAAMLNLGYIDEKGQPTGGGSGEIILVSDGQSNCPPDPCQVVRDTRIPVVVHTVGFLLAEDDTAAEQELRCIAQVTGGISVTVKKAGDTIAAIRPIVREQNVVHHVKNVPHGFTKRYSWWRFTDRDNDGIPDKWEENGVFRSIWAGGRPIGEEWLDLPASGADPDRKDLFIYYDWEEGAKFDEEVLDIVWSAFADAPLDAGNGIWLHFIEGTEIPSKEIPSFSGSNDEATQKAELTAMFEATAEYSGFDQSMWAGQSQRAGLPQLAKYLLIRRPCDPTCPFGQAYSSPGNFGVIFMGGEEWCQSVIDRVGYCWLDTDEPPPEIALAHTYYQAGTVMHILGHLLGLHDHGKESCPRVDPSYRSVMSHAYTAVGIEQSDGAFLLDYARDATVNLDWKSGTFGKGIAEDHSCLGAPRKSRDNDGSITLVLNQYAENPDFYLHEIGQLRFGTHPARQEASLVDLIDSVPDEYLESFAEYFGLRQVPETFRNT